MSIMDENEETMSRLDMKVNNEWRKSQEEDETDPILPSHAATAHWTLGTAYARMTSTRMETVNRSNSLYHDFNMRLREYLPEHHPKHPVCDDENIQVGISLKIRVFEAN
jgi:ABC-type sugar transport system ATPase subunit